MTLLRLGTRRSKLAQKQNSLVMEHIKRLAPDVACEVVFIETTGDTFMGDLSKVGGKGVFVKEIEEALLEGRIDAAVHSMKDVPMDLPQGLVIQAVLPRHDMRDVVLCRGGKSFVGLVAGSKIGTSSLRRASQLKAAFPALDIVPIRGNIDTRIQKMENGDVNALVLAKAGIDLMGWQESISEVFEPDMLCPALAQGIVGIETRAEDVKTNDILSKINHQDTFTCLMAERRLAKVLGVSCHTSVAGYCEVTKGGNLRMIALVAAPDGSKIVRGRDKADYAQGAQLAEIVADQLLVQGAAELMKEITTD